MPNKAYKAWRRFGGMMEVDDVRVVDSVHWHTCVLCETNERCSRTPISLLWG